MHTLSRHAPRAARSFRPFRWIDAAFATYRHRTRLDQLDPHLLHDVGLTRTDVETETNRPFWDIPDWWR